MTGLRNVQPGLSFEDLYKFIKKLVEMRQGQVCRHYIMCLLLEEMEKHGDTLDADFVRAIVDADDEKALQYLQKRLEAEDGTS